MQWNQNATKLKWNQNAVGGGEVSAEKSREEETQSQSVWGVSAQSVCEGGILKKCARAFFFIKWYGPRAGPF